MDELQALYMSYFAAFSVMAGVTVPIVVKAWLEFWKPKTKVWRSIWSWIIPVAVGMVGWLLGVFIFKDGFLANLVWTDALIYGAWAAIMGNVAWDNVPWLKEIINQLFVYLLSKK